MADTQYVVTAACAVVRVGEHRLVTLQQNAAVPADADPEHLQLLIDRGLVAEGEAAAGLVHDAVTTPPFVPADSKKEPASGQVVEHVDPEGEGDSKDEASAKSSRSRSAKAES